MEKSNIELLIHYGELILILRQAIVHNRLTKLFLTRSNTCFSGQKQIKEIEEAIQGKISELKELGKTTVFLLFGTDDLILTRLWYKLNWKEFHLSGTELKEGYALIDKEEKYVLFLNDYKDIKWNITKGDILLYKNCKDILVNQKSVLTEDCTYMKLITRESSIPEFKLSYNSGEKTTKADDPF